MLNKPVICALTVGLVFLGIVRAVEIWTLNFEKNQSARQTLTFTTSISKLGFGDGGITAYNFVVSSIDGSVSTSVMKDAKTLEQPFTVSRSNGANFPNSRYVATVSGPYYCSDITLKHCDQVGTFVSKSLDFSIDDSISGSKAPSNSYAISPSYKPYNTFETACPAGYKVAELLSEQIGDVLQMLSKANFKGTYWYKLVRSTGDKTPGFLFAGTGVATEASPQSTGSYQALCQAV